MDNELLKKWTDMNKTAMDAMKELGEINTAAMTRLTQRQMEMVNLYMESGAKQLQAMGEVKNVQDMVNVQSRLFAEMNEKLMENARQTIEILVDVKSELASWAEKGMEVANANLPNVAKK
ncbi:phasin family protein [Beggiatoa leptomitoformis]|uniref:TIGR01841 family phasin n=1 Tax=Beggiatoa leptomitoformis TaxID=288004 RepID=A0A2N9YGW2_9GAMM|nr:phasin family protein [Beggiatoa leptomitoformis]ALG67983.1 TIGR01841 family phasin [Beggiatoa leptomitoformis]AUI69737.1 TIGR01841 family phasin [Beggiatoa leptomitoformis]